MYIGLSAVIRRYEKYGFSGLLKFAISEADGVPKIDLCEDTTVPVQGTLLDIKSLPHLCNRLRYGLIFVYFDGGKVAGYTYKINYQGESYRRLERESLLCSTVKIAAGKSNT